MVQKDITNLRHALDFFNAGYGGLVKAWDKVQENNEVQNILSTNYPFEYSFDEYDVKEWTYNAKQMLKDIEVK